MAIRNRTRRYGWSTLQQGWKLTGRPTYFTTAWLNDRVVCKQTNENWTTKIYILRNPAIIYVTVCSVHLMRFFLVPVWPSWEFFLSNVVTSQQTLPCMLISPVHATLCKEYTPGRRMLDPTHHVLLLAVTQTTRSKRSSSGWKNSISFLCAHNLKRKKKVLFFFLLISFGLSYLFFHDACKTSRRTVESLCQQQNRRKI